MSYKLKRIVEFTVITTNGNVIPGDTVVANSSQTAADEINNIIDNFNTVEKNRYGDTADLRKLKSIDNVLSIEKFYSKKELNTIIPFSMKRDVKNEHNFIKVNLVTKKSDKGYCDEYVCSWCGIKGKVYGLDGIITGKSKMKLVKFCNG